MTRRTAPPGRGTPREFCGAAYPWPLLDRLADGDQVRACYLVREKQRLETRQGKPYLKLVLADRTGDIVAHVWDDADHWAPLCEVGLAIGAAGRAGVYQERLQLKLECIQPLEPDAADWERLVPSSPREAARMDAELDALIGSVTDAPLRDVLSRCLGAGTELGRAFRAHAAAKRNHHAYRGGLLEHSLSVAHAVDRLAVHYREQGWEVDRDLLVTGALLHDIGKLRELDPPPAVSYTTEGQLLGHIVIGMQMVRDAAADMPGLDDERLLLLLHLVASHQGRPEWDSRVPQTVEAMILHYADDLDAKLNQARQALRGVEPGGWSAYDRGLERSLFQPSRPAPDSAPEPKAQRPAPEPTRARACDETLDLLLDVFPRES